METLPRVTRRCLGSPEGPVLQTGWQPRSGLRALGREVSPGHTLQGGARVKTGCGSSAEASQALWPQTVQEGKNPPA